MRKIHLLTGILTLVALTLSACSAKQAEAAPQPAAAAAAASGLIAEGSLRPVHVLDQSFGQAGKIAEVLVQDGEAVNAGQALARLADSPESEPALARAEQELLAAEQALETLNEQAELKLAQAKLAVAVAKDALEEAKDDYASNRSELNQTTLDAAAVQVEYAQTEYDRLFAAAGPDPDLLAAAEARLTVARASLASLQAARDALTLKASMDGVVIDLDLQPGQTLTAGAPALTLADLSSWQVETDNLTELDVTAVSLGQAVEVVFDALPEVTLKGEVSHIAARFAEKRGDVTYTVAIRLSDPDPRLRWGMTAAVNFPR